MPQRKLSDPQSAPPQEDVANIRDRLSDWYGQSARRMPWRETRDPYRIWVAEVMLQQTRVDQVHPYYQRFISSFPTVYALAEAGQDEVLKVWEGLGYYTRARNLHRAAKRVVADFRGKLPGSHDEIMTLPGIGPYTSAAILSMAFGKPYAVLDGNVARVLARLLSFEGDIKAYSSRHFLQKQADVLLDPEKPAGFNQAMMELGATVCLPVRPRCTQCPIQDFCSARRNGRQDNLPVTKPSAPVPHHNISAGLIVREDGHILISRRPDEVMLGGLWEFPGGKQEPGETIEETCYRELKEELGIEIRVIRKFMRVNHAYSHFRITLHAFWCRIESGTPRSAGGTPVIWSDIRDLDQYAFPRANRVLIDAMQKLDAADDSFGTDLS